jgi:hypothetical protein
VGVKGFHALNINRNFSLPDSGLTRQPEGFGNPTYRYPPMPRWPQSVGMISQRPTIGSECAARERHFRVLRSLRTGPVRFILWLMARHRETENRLTGYILFVDHTPSVWQKSHGLPFPIGCFSGQTDCDRTMLGSSGSASNAGGSVDRELAGRLKLYRTMIF